MKITNRRIGFTLTTITAVLLLLFCLDLQDIEDRGEEASVSIDVAKIKLDDESTLRGDNQETVYLGTDTNYIIKLNDSTTITVRDQNGVTGDARYSKGQSVGLHIPDSSVRMLAD